MDDTIPHQLKPGVKVTVTQNLPHGDRVWTNKVYGTIVSFAQRQTGSWFAHSKDDKLWLDRLKIRKADGEITTLNLDEFSQIEIEAPPPPAPAAAVPVEEKPAA